MGKGATNFFHDIQFVREPHYIALLQPGGYSIKVDFCSGWSKEANTPKIRILKVNMKKNLMHKSSVFALKLSIRYANERFWGVYIFT